MRQHEYKKYLNGLSTEDRISRACDCIAELTRRIQFVLELNAINKHLGYSDLLGAQIEDGNARRSLLYLRDATWQMEVIRLIALWDKPAENSFSIPTAIALINEGKVVQTLCDQIFDHHANSIPRILNPSDDPELEKAVEEAFKAHQVDFATRQRDKAEIALKAAIAASVELVYGPLRIGLANLRDHVSHSLFETRREASGEVPSPKYGQEKELLNRSVGLIEDLYTWVNGTSFDIAGACHDMAMRNAEALFEGLKFDNP